MAASPHLPQVPTGMAQVALQHGAPSPGEHPPLQLHPCQRLPLPPTPTSLHKRELALPLTSRAHCGGQYVFSKKKEGEGETNPDITNMQLSLNATVNNVNHWLLGLPPLPPQGPTLNKLNKQKSNSDPSGNVQTNLYTPQHLTGQHSLPVG